MFFNWFKKENKINNQREELLKEAQKNEDRLDPCLPKKTLPKSGAIKQKKENTYKIKDFYFKSQIFSCLKKIIKLI